MDKKRNIRLKNCRAAHVLPLNPELFIEIVFEGNEETKWQTRLAHTNLTWFWPCIVVNMWKIKCQLDATEVFIADLIACSTCFIQWLLPVVFRAVAFQVAGLVWSWGLCVRSAGCCSILQTGHITLSNTPDQQLENHSTKSHTQQPLYNTLELLMMGIVMPETCWASNKIYNKNFCCI